MKYAAVAIFFLYALILVTCPAMGADPAPSVWIHSPLDGFATNAELIIVEVGFEAWIDPDTGDVGNVKDLDLFMNGVFLETKVNPPDIKTGVMPFEVDLTGMGDQVIEFKAYAYQGNRKLNHRGESGPIELILDRTPPIVTILSPENLFIALNEPRVSATVHFVDNLAGVPPERVYLSLDTIDVSSALQHLSPAEALYEPSLDLTEGQHLYEATAMDLAGNSSPTAAAVFDVVFADAAERIGAAGGSVSITTGAGQIVVLNIPEGALGEPTVVSIREVDDPIPEENEDVGRVVEFRPHGLSFAVPAEVKFSVDYPEYTSIYHFDGSEPHVWDSEGRETCGVSSVCASIDTLCCQKTEPDELCHYDEGHPNKPICTAVGYHPSMASVDSPFYPVLLIHGLQGKFFDDPLIDSRLRCSKGSYKTWGNMPALLRDKGLDVWQLNYDTNRLIRDTGPSVNAAIQNILYVTNKEYVTVVAHSMGGLVTRAYLQNWEFAGSAKVARTIMVGTPNFGTFCGQIGAFERRCECAADLAREGNYWLQTLNFNDKVDPKTLQGPLPQYILIGGVNRYIEYVGGVPTCLIDTHECFSALPPSTAMAATDGVVGLDSALGMLNVFGGFEHIYPQSGLAHRFHRDQYSHTGLLVDDECGERPLVEVDDESHYVYRDILHYVSIPDIAEDFVDDFNDGDFYSDPQWTELPPDDVPRYVDVIGGELRFFADVPYGNGGWSGIFLDTDLAVTEDTVVRFDGNPVYRNVGAGCGWSCGEFPVNVQLTLEREGGGQVELRYSMNYGGAVADKTTATYIQRAFSVPQNVWTHKELRIRDEWPDATKVTKIRLFAAGWSYEGWLDNLEIAEAQ